MKQTINETQFRDAFYSIRPDNFTYEGLGILFEALENTEDNEEMELDVIAFCCDYSEMSESEIKDSYNVNLEESSKDMYDWLSDKTWVLGSHEKDEIKYFIFQQF